MCVWFYVYSMCIGTYKVPPKEVESPGARVLVNFEPSIVGTRILALLWKSHKCSYELMHFVRNGGSPERMYIVDMDITMSRT